MVGWLGTDVPHRGYNHIEVFRAAENKTIAEDRLLSSEDLMRWQQKGQDSSISLGPEMMAESLYSVELV